MVEASTAPWLECSNSCELLQTVMWIHRRSSTLPNQDIRLLIMYKEVATFSNVRHEYAHKAQMSYQSQPSRSNYTLLWSQQECFCDASGYTYNKLSNTSSTRYVLWGSVYCINEALTGADRTRCCYVLHHHNCECCLKLYKNKGDEKGFPEQFRCLSARLLAWQRSWCRLLQRRRKRCHSRQSWGYPRKSQNTPDSSTFADISHFEVAAPYNP